MRAKSLYILQHNVFLVEYCINYDFSDLAYQNRFSFYWCISGKTLLVDTIFHQEAQSWHNRVSKLKRTQHNDIVGDANA